VNGNTRT